MGYQQCTARDLNGALSDMSQSANDVVGEQLVYFKCKVMIKFQESSAGERLNYQPA